MLVPLGQISEMNFSRLLCRTPFGNSRYLALCSELK